MTDLDAWADRLTAAGYPADRDDDLPGMRRFSSHDPHGNRLELLEPLPAAPQPGSSTAALVPAPGRAYGRRP